MTQNTNDFNALLTDMESGESPVASKRDKTFI